MGHGNRMQRSEYAVMLVPERSEPTVPPDQVKHINPLMTMVAGRTVFEVN